MNDWTPKKVLLRLHPGGTEICTEAQFDRWVREGLLPRGKQVHTPGLQGSESLYPPGTDRQLLALRELRERERRLERLLVLMWWQGYTVDETALRDALKRLLQLQLNDLLKTSREARRSLRSGCRNGKVRREP